MRPYLSKGAVKLIHSSVDELFDKALVRILGLDFGPKRIVIGVKPELTLAGLFASASAEEGNNGDPNLLASLLQIAKGYVEAQREATKARVVKSVNAFLRDADAKGVDTDVKTVLGGELAQVWKQTTTAMHTIVDTEASNVRNVGTLDGIVKVNAASGIEDPVIYFVVVNDDILCGECKRLHLLEDDITPRAWYLSEVGNGFHRKGDPSPKVGGLHPHCRCSLVALMPGYGFRAGRVAYIGEGHNEIEAQRA